MFIDTTSTFHILANSSQPNDSAQHTHSILYTDNTAEEISDLLPSKFTTRSIRCLNCLLRLCGSESRYTRCMSLSLHIYITFTEQRPISGYVTIRTKLGARFIVASNLVGLRLFISNSAVVSWKFNWKSITHLGINQLFIFCFVFISLKITAHYKSNVISKYVSLLYLINKIIRVLCI